MATINLSRKHKCDGYGHTGECDHTLEVSYQSTSDVLMIKTADGDRLGLMSDETDALISIICELAERRVEIEGAFRRAGYKLEATK